MLGNTATVRIEGVDDSEWIIHGDAAQASPVRLLEGSVGELFDAPVNTTYKGVVGQAGKKYLAKNYLERNIVLNVITFGDSSTEWIETDSQFRQAFDYDQPCKLIVETEHSGERWLDVRLSEAPAFKGDRDPNSQNAAIMQYVLIAADPWWHSDVLTGTFTFTGSNWGGDGVAISNPGDIPVWPQWALTAPAKYGLPDVSFKDDKDKNRFIFLPFQGHGHEVFVDTDPMQETIVDIDETQMWAQLNGQKFKYPLPAHLGNVKLPVYIDPLPKIPFVFPSEWKWWIATELSTWAKALGADKILAITPENIGEQVRKIILGVTPDFLEPLGVDLISRLTSKFIAGLIRNTYGNLGNIAGATAQIIVEPCWSRPWGMD